MERKKVPQLSDDAISLLKLLPKKWKYIARDKNNIDNEACVYTEKPAKTYWTGGIIYFKPEPFANHIGGTLLVFNELFECLPIGECYLIEDLIKGE